MKYQNNHQRNASDARKKYSLTARMSSSNPIYIYYCDMASVLEKG